ncbi:MAG: TlpA family protein disulfide reductase [Anaerolineales bacterium]|nr:TlpA family protein disulfide reductase [Anaerolineales bacterium]
MTYNRLAQNELTKGKYDIRRLVFVSFIILVLLSACSGKVTSQLEASAGGINSSARTAGDVQKPAQLANEPPQQQKEAPQAPNGVGGGGIAPLTSDSMAAQPAEALPKELQAAFVAAPPESATSEGQPGAAVDLSIPVGPQIGYRAPDFSLQTLDGAVVQLSDLLGKPVLISYWATWCVPCKNELGILSRVYAEYQARGFQVLTVNAIEQDSLGEVQSAVDQMGMSFPVLLDHGEQFAQAYQALFFPTTIYVDANGVIRYIALGDSSEAEFRAKIEQLLSGEW